MKKTSNRLHSLFAALAALILAAALAVPAFAVEGGFADLYYRMFDDAEVLTEDEDNELEDALEELSLRQSFDVTIATIESLESVDYDSMEAYADDLYDYCQFGYGPEMDGVLLLAFVLGFPANEIVLPIAVMGYLAQGSLGDSLGLAQMHVLLTANGWTWTTAVSAVLFFLLHWPCSTTLWTIRRETGSTKWTLLAALLPTAMGMALCTAFTALARALGW